MLSSLFKRTVTWLETEAVSRALFSNRAGFELKFVKIFRADFEPSYKIFLQRRTRRQLRLMQMQSSWLNLQ